MRGVLKAIDPNVRISRCSEFRDDFASGVGRDDGWVHERKLAIGRAAGPSRRKTDCLLDSVGRDRTFPLCSAIGYHRCFL